MMKTTPRHKKYIYGREKKTMSGGKGKKIKLIDTRRKLKKREKDGQMKKKMQNRRKIDEKGDYGDTDARKKGRKGDKEDTRKKRKKTHLKRR